MATVRDFLNVYALYRRHHPRKTALVSAWRISVTGLPF